MDGQRGGGSGSGESFWQAVPASVRQAVPNPVGGVDSDIDAGCGLCVGVGDVFVWVGSTWVAGGLLGAVAVVPRVTGGGRFDTDGLTEERDVAGMGGGVGVVDGGDVDECAGGRLGFRDQRWHADRARSASDLGFDGGAGRSPSGDVFVGAARAEHFECVDMATEIGVHGRWRWGSSPHHPRPARALSWLSLFNSVLDSHAGSSRINIDVRYSVETRRPLCTSKSQTEHYRRNHAASRFVLNAWVIHFSSVKLT